MSLFIHTGSEYATANIAGPPPPFPARQFLSAVTGELASGRRRLTEICGIASVSSILRVFQKRLIPHLDEMCISSDDIGSGISASCSLGRSLPLGLNGCYILICLYGGRFFTRLVYRGLTNELLYRLSSRTQADTSEFSHR